MSDKLVVESPYDLSQIAEVERVSESEMESAINRAHKLFLDQSLWLKPHQRIAILERTAELMQERRAELVTTALSEGGKPYIDTCIEVDRAIQGVKLAASSLDSLAGEEIPMGLTPSSANRLAFTFREPIGLVASLSAFNHPLNLIVHQTAPAIAVGAPVMVKPASTTPLSCFKFMELLYEAGLPREFCQAFACSNQVAEKLATDKRVNFLSFIGSGAIGWYLRSKLAEGTRCALEHGGVAPVIVDSNADVEEILPLLSKGAFYHAGQVCVSVQRIYVHSSVAAKLASGLTELASKLVVGDPADENTEVGPLITPKEVDRVEAWVNEAKEAGAEILCGGERISKTCYQPTVILNPPENVQVSSEEVFGPVVCIYEYEDRNEAILRANSLPFAFQASVFTKDLDVALDAVKKLNATAVMVNDHTAFRVDWMPFGGRDASGLGLGGIQNSMHEMTREKLMVLKSGAL